MSSETPSRIPSLDGLRVLSITFVFRLRQQFERRLSLHDQQSEPTPERALILPFDAGTPSTRAERLLRLNARPVSEDREEKPTGSFLPALQRIERFERRATLSDALGRLKFQIKSKK